MRFLTRPEMLLLFALLLMLTSGCRASFRAAAAEAPHAAIPGVVDETLKAGEDARTRQRLALVLATPEMTQAISAIAKASVSAALEEASSEASEERIAELTIVVARALAESIETDIVPAVMSGTSKSLRENVSSGDMKAMEGALGSLAAASTRAAMRAAAAELPATVAPAARESLAHELEAPELRAAVAGLVAEATRQALVTSRQTVIDAQAESAAAGKPTLIGRARRILTVSWGLAFALGAVGVALAAWGFRMRRRTKRYRGALLELVATKKETGEGDPARMQRFLELLQ